MIQEKPFPGSQDGRPFRSPLAKDIGIASSGGRSDDAARTGLRGFVFKGKLYPVYSTPFDTPFDILKQLGISTPDNKKYRFVFLNGEKAMAFVQISLSGNVKPQVEIIEEDF